MLTKQNKTPNPSGSVLWVPWATWQQTELQRGWLTKFWPCVGARVPLQTNKQNMCGWFTQTPAPQNVHKASCFVESTLVVAQVPGSGAHDGLAIFWKQPCRLQNFGTTTEASTGIFQIFVERCRCPWHEEPNPAVQAGHLFRFSLNRNIAWEHVFLSKYMFWMFWVMRVSQLQCLNLEVTHIAFDSYCLCQTLLCSTDN